MIALRTALPAVLLLSYVAQPTLSQTVQTDAQQAVAATRLLDAWRAENPEPGERVLHLVCWTPADRELPADYPARLDRIMKHVQAFYGDEMERLGFGRRSISLPLNAEGTTVLHTVRGRYPASHYGKPSGAEIRAECVPVLAAQGIDADRETIVLFCNLATWDEKALRFSHESPYYASGSGARGTAWQLDSPELDVPNLQRTRPLLFDAQYGRISLGKHNSIFIGGIAHELGHALGLPHATVPAAEAARGVPLMGSGNRAYGDDLRGEGPGSVLNFPHALRLASHPQFSGSIKALRDPASAAFNDLAVVTRGRSIEVSGAVAGTPPVYGVVAYFDPAGGGDYDAFVASAVPDERGRFTLSATDFPPGKKARLRLVPLHCNGAVPDRRALNGWSFPYRVDESGVPDVSATATRLELAPLLAALAADDAPAARRALDGLRSPQAQRLGAALLSPPPRDRTPAEADETMRSAPLTHFKPTAARVGWKRPTYDSLPDPAVLLESDGDLYKTGLYAHAPATHEYPLGGRWTTLRGRVGLAAGYAGSVLFKIAGDGRTLWQSDTVTESNGAAFEVDVSGVQVLRLTTEPTADGAARDWGLWLEPTLSR